MHFLQEVEIGQGVFLRGDFGGARVAVDSSEFEGFVTSAFGYGFLLGGGLGVPISPGTRVLFHANYSFRRIEGERSTALNLAFSFLF